MMCFLGRTTSWVWLRPLASVRRAGESSWGHFNRCFYGGSPAGFGFGLSLQCGELVGYPGGGHSMWSLTQCLEASWCFSPVGSLLRWVSGGNSQEAP